MDENLKLKIGLDSLNKANAYKVDKNYGRAFAHYLVYFELLPNGAEEYEAEFSEVICSWCSELENRNQIENLCKCYLQALHYFPTSSEILNNFGSHLIRIDQNEEANKYLRLAHNLDKDFLPAEKNLMTAKLNLVPRWHFRMLNDYERNKSYHEAITCGNFGENLKVLDIGAGCGILSLFASERNDADSIYAVEQSKSMAFVAKSVFEEHESKIKLVNKNSTDLLHSDIGGYADLLIMEIFDTALFGEHVLETVIHAWDNLLKKNARVIPASANVYVTGIQCLDILKKHKFVGKLNLVDCKDFCLTQIIGEPYDAENLQRFKFKKITETAKIITVDFNNVEQLKNIYNNENFNDFISLHAIERGQIDAFVIWFDLQLGNDITITTDPQNERENCWEQAVIYIDHPYQVNKDDDIALKISCLDNRLSLNVLNEETCKRCFKVSSDTISFLNDAVLVSQLEKFSESFRNVVILDLYKFPLVGLILAKKGSKCYCCVNDDEDKMLLKHVCSINNISFDNVIILKDDEMDQLLERQNLFDVILVDPVSEYGTLDEKSCINFDLYRNCLKQKGLIYPQSVNLYVQVVDSEYLDYYNRVDDKNLFGYKIAQHINEYSILEQWVIDLKFRHKKLSDSLEISNVFQNDDRPHVTDCIIPIISDGRANGVLYWFELVYNHAIKINTNTSTHYNCACFLLENKEVVDEGSTLKICVKQHRGLLKIFCNAPQ